MFSNLMRLFKAAQNSVKSFSITSQRTFKVAVIGAATDIGQSLCMLLKFNPLVKHLAIHDNEAITPGIIFDLSHVDNHTLLTYHMGPEQLGDAIKCAHLVMVTAGKSAKPGKISEDTFKTNGSIIHDVATAVAKHSPHTMLAIVTNPLNSMVPLASEVLKQFGCYNPLRIFGVTTVDLVNSRKFIGQIMCVNPQTVTIPVIGGHSSTTTIPVLSQSVPRLCYCHPNDFERLTKVIREATFTVEKAKGWAGGPSLSQAYAAANFANSILKALSGEKVLEFTYIRSNVTEATYFSNLVMLGKEGVEFNYGLSCLTCYEYYLLQTALPILIRDIENGAAFGRK